MKKFLVIMLSLMLALTMFTACGQTEETTGDVKEESVLTDPEIKISDNLPTFNMKGTYTPAENKYADTENVLWTYAGDENSEYSYVAEYTWDAAGMTLEEAAKADADEYYSDQNLDISVTDCWHEPGEVENAYYCAYDEAAKGFVQSWIFKDGDKFYQVAAVIEGVEYTIDELEIALVLPKTMEKLETPLEGAIVNFVDAGGQFPTFNIYNIPSETEFTPEGIAAAWGVSNVKVEEHDFFDNNGDNTFAGYKLTYDFESDGTKFIGDEDVLFRNGRYEGYEFTRPADHLIGTSLTVEEKAMLFAVRGIE